MENNQQDSFLQMHLDYDSGKILQETVRWSRFLSIVWIVGISLGLLFFAIAGTALFTLLSRFAPVLAGLGAALIVVAILVFLAIFGVSVFMLFRFSQLTRRGIQQQDQVVFTDGMRCLKIYFIIHGAFAILSLLGSLSTLTKLLH